MRAQDLLAKGRRLKPLEEPALFSGYAICADCGSRMHIARTRSELSSNPSSYICSGYRKRIKECTIHYIREAEKPSATFLIVLNTSGIQSISEHTRSPTRTRKP